MAGTQTVHVEVENDLRGCTNLLKSVVCEWLLIVFLLVDAVYLYFLKKFAKYCNLQLPCILCSRLDHIFGNEKPDFYKDLICNEHRSKLSSLVFCHNHGCLADVHDICEECLLSFATKKDSSPEIYKFLIGKLGLDGLGDPISEIDFFHGFVSVKSCSCCNKQWRCRPNVQKLVKSQSFGSRFSKPDNIPLPTTPRQKLLNQAGNSKMKISSDSECGSRHDHDKLSFKKQFEERFTTKKVSSPNSMVASDTPRQQTQSELISKYKHDDNAETWEAFDLVSPKIGGVDDEDKKDGITITNFNTELDHSNFSSTQKQIPSSLDDKDKTSFGYGDEELNKEIEENQEIIHRLRLELEEERSASAEAANQAMAMITKLQEEKAVLNMDAQQYLRMMEEQAEHDLEALENANDLLTEREKEMQDMEAELEFYRIKYPDEYEQEFAHAELISQGLGMR